MNVGSGKRDHAARSYGTAAAVLLAGAQLSCGREETPPRLGIRLVFASAPETLDPQRHQEDVTRMVLANFYEGLVDFDVGLGVRPRLAVDWSSPSERQWRFRLRQGVTFHDGTPFGAQDVVRTLERARTAPGSRVDGDIRSIALVRVVDAHTIELVTDRPRPLLLAKLAQIAILPRGTTDEEIRHPVGTGPYRFLRGAGTTGSPVRGTRWEFYWGAAPPFASFTAEFAADQDELARAARGGAEIVSPLPADAFREGSEGTAPFLAFRSPTLTLSFLVCRVAPLAGGRPSPFRDRRVRHAVDRALDRSRLVVDGLEGEGRPVWQLAVHGVSGFDPGVAPRGADPAGARKLLAEAGYPNGLDSVLVVPARRLAVGNELARQLRAAGLRLKVESEAWSTILPRMREGRAPLALASWTLSTGDVSGLFEPVLHGAGGPEGFGSENTSGYSDPEVDAAIEKAAQEMHPSARIGLLAEVMRRAMTDLPLVPLYGLDWTYGIRRTVRFSPRLDNSVVAADVHPAIERR